MLETVLVMHVSDSQHLIQTVIIINDQYQQSPVHLGYWCDFYQGHLRLVFNLIKVPSKQKRFFCDLKIFWDEIKSIFCNANWRLLLGSFVLINGCIEAFQIEAIFMIRNVLSGSPDKIHLQVSLVLCALWISKLASSLIAGLIADRFHNFKKLGLGRDFRAMPNMRFHIRI